VCLYAQSGRQNIPAQLGVPIHSNNEALAKKQKLLSPDRLSKLICDSDSDKYGAPDSSSEGTGGYGGQPGVSLQLDSPISGGQASMVHIFPVPLMKRKLFRMGHRTQLSIPSTSQWTQPSFPQTSVVHTYAGGPEEGRTVKCHTFLAAPVHLYFLLVFCQNFLLLVVETNHYYHDRVDRRQRTFTLTWHYWGWNVCVSGNNK
jgi:hypothetical protein